MDKIKSLIRYVVSIKHLIIDFFLFVSIISIFVCESIFVKNGDSSWKSSFEKLNYVDSLNIVSVLIPAVITIVSIVLQLNQEKIRGVTRTEFSKLRTTWAQGFLSMSILMILMFALSSVALIISFRLTQISLSFVGLVYATWFLVQEIPLMVQNDHCINSIIANFYQRSNRQVVNIKDQSEFDIFTRTIRYSIFNFGLKETFLALKTKAKSPEELLDFLLDIQNQYLYSILNNQEIIKQNIDIIFEGLSVIKTINVGFYNVRDLVSYSNDFDYSKIYKDSKRLYMVSRNIFALHGIAKTISINRKEKSMLTNIMYTLISNIKYRKNFEKQSIALLTMLVVSTVQYGETWIIAAIRDITFPSAIYKARSIGFFFLVYCFFIINRCRTAPEEAKKQVKSFLNESCLSLNSDGDSWISKARKQLQYADEDQLAALLNDFLFDYDQIDPDRYTVYGPLCTTITLDETTEFSKNLLVDVWIELLLFTPGIYGDGERICDALDKLSDENKEIVATKIKEKLLDDFGNLKSNIEPDFLAFIGLKRPMSYIDPKLLSKLYKFSNDFFLKKELETIESEAVADADLNSFKTKLKKAFDKLCHSMDVFDNSLSLDNCFINNFGVRFNASGISELIDLYKENLSYDLGSLISNFIRTQEITSIDSDNYKLTPEVVSQVMSFGPDFMSSGSSLEYYANTDEKEIIAKNITTSNVCGLSRNLYWKGGAIRVAFEYLPEQSTFRRLKPDEIDYVIDNEYTMINGLYKYKKYSNSDISSFFVTREKLAEMISKTTFYSLITFKWKIIINRDGILKINIKN